ncbi:NADPH-dependent F420 reductase [Gryllotalpicola protaetiae]|uniref:NADP oxidoreductase n=1 Tax=Gryllotalpicola protaetiae TaxID=2419771 RepID=A0A387BJG7_9MICO|nr:NAD(P)-binding domain-containing protein [Gryllotalpicola protaetiae]AYG03973.1 NADP oxidoreductase [Gryllotalpicola protaetiae]
MTTLGFVGAGQIGGTVARLAAQLGYNVVVSNSRAPETLADLVAEIGPNARAAWAAEASAAADIAFVSIPLKNIWQLDPAPLAGKIVLETNNYYPARDGQIVALDEERATTTGLLQEHLPESRVVKAFNHINWRHIPVQGLPAGDPGRRALAIASDHADALEFARRFYDELGFDAVDIGSVAESWRAERDTPAYGPRLTAAELEAALAQAERGADAA